MNSKSVLLAVVVMVGLVCSNMAYASMVAQQLATIEAGGHVAKDDITVARFRSLLDRLSSMYAEDRQEIADDSVTAQRLLRDDGISESLMKIMEGLSQLFTTQVKNQKYREYVAAYVTLRGEGKSHSDAIRGLQAFLRGLGVH